MSNNFFTNLVAGVAKRADVNTALGQIDDALTKFRDGVNSFVQLNFGATSTLTLNASGAITVTRTRHRVDTFAAVASDELETISGGADGDELFLQIVNAARVVIVKHNTGNIFLAAQSDFSFSSVNEVLHLVYDATNAKWMEAQTRTTLVTTPYVRVEDQKAKGTVGGTAAVAAWQTRVLNTEVQDTGGYASVASNQVTLAAGTWDIKVKVPGLQCGFHRAVVRNDTAGAVVLIGASGFVGGGDATEAHTFVQGRVTIASPAAFSVRHYTQLATGGTSGLGVAANINDPDGAGMLEVYTVFEAWKVA